MGGGQGCAGRLDTQTVATNPHRRERTWRESGQAAEDRSGRAGSRTRKLGLARGRSRPRAGRRND